MRRRWSAVGSVVLVLALGAAGCGFGSSDATLRGSILVKDMNIRTIGGTCSGARPFLHVHPGATVEVRDAEDQPVATGELEGTESVLALAELEELERAPSGCRLDFRVDGVPESPSYTIEVAGRHAVSRTYAELEEDDWMVDMEVPE